MIEGPGWASLSVLVVEDLHCVKVKTSSISSSQTRCRLTCVQDSYEDRILNGRFAKYFSMLYPEYREGLQNDFLRGKVRQEMERLVGPLQNKLNFKENLVHTHQWLSVFWIPFHAASGTFSQNHPILKAAPVCKPI